MYLNFWLNSTNFYLEKNKNNLITQNFFIQINLFWWFLYTNNKFIFSQPLSWKCYEPNPPKIMHNIFNMTKTQATTLCTSSSLTKKLNTSRISYKPGNMLPKDRQICAASADGLWRGRWAGCVQTDRVSCAKNCVQCFKLIWFIWLGCLLDDAR